jgi:polysaccharide biosynthesis protein PslE
MIVQVTPRGLLGIFFRHWFKFALVFLFFFGTATAYCVIATPKYMSEAKLLVKFAGNQASRQDALPTSTISAQQLERKEVVNSQISVLQSKDLIRDVLHTLGIERIYPTLAAGTEPAALQDAAERRFAYDFNAEAEKDADVIDLTVINPDAAVGAQTLQTMINKFITMQSKIYQSGQLGFLQQQMTQARNKLEQARAAVRNFKAAAGISSLDEERSLLLKQQSDVRIALTQEISHQEEAQGRYARLEEQLKQIPNQIKLSDENDRFKAVDDGRQHLNELQSREKELSINYRPDSQTMTNLHSEILFAQQQLAQMSRESAARIRTGANPVRQSVEIDLAKAAGDQFSATAGRASYEAELARINKRLADLETQGVRLDELELQQQVDEENFRNLLQEVEDARVADDLNRERISSIAVVQAPTIPLKAARPRKLLIMGIGLLLGVAGGIALVLISEMADESFATPDQIEAVAGLPVLGTFSRARLGGPSPARSRAVSVGLSLLLLMALAAAPTIAKGVDLLDPDYGRRLAVRGTNDKVVEVLVPTQGRFMRHSATGEPLGWAKRVGRTLMFYDLDGHVTATARRELLPINSSLSGIAILRDPLGHPIGAISRN